MKKLLPGLIAIGCALAFLAFNKPFANHTFKLLHDPVSVGIIENPSEWSTSGATYGQCFTLQNDIACFIKLNTIRSSYFHTEGANQVLNTFIYSSSFYPKQDYLDITETSSGVGNDRIITSITPKTWISEVGYITTYLGNDLTWKNAKD